MSNIKTLSNPTAPSVPLPSSHPLYIYPGKTVYTFAPTGQKYTIDTVDGEIIYARNNYSECFISKVNKNYYNFYTKVSSFFGDKDNLKEICIQYNELELFECMFPPPKEKTCCGIKARWIINGGANLQYYFCDKCKKEVV